MKTLWKVVIFLVIWIVAVLIVNQVFAGDVRATKYVTFRMVTAPYVEMYGRPNVTDKERFKDLTLGKAYVRMYQWDKVATQVIFIRVRRIRGGSLNSSNGWIVYGVFGRCMQCGKYHIPLPEA